MQRTCTTEESMQSRSSISTGFPIVVVGGGGMDGVDAPLTLQFFSKSPPPPKPMPPWGTPLPLINEVPPSEKQTAPVET